MDYEAIFSGLSREMIDYLIVGGLAVNFHGIPRMTYDIDVMISLEKPNILKTVSMLDSWGYRPQVAVDPRDLTDQETRNQWIQDKNMRALSFYNQQSPMGEIDLIIDTPIPYERLKAGAVIFEVKGNPVPVVSIQDLIELKRLSGRRQDNSDVEHLLKVMQDDG
jgi:hypothetical protein